MYKFILGTAALVAALAIAGAALGAPGTQGYRGQAGGVLGELQGQGGGGAGGSGVLPFTGQDLTIIVLGGVALILAGSGFYRLNRRRT